VRICSLAPDSASCLRRRCWGGKTKTYDVIVDLNKLVDYGLTLQQVLQVLNNSNINVGGQTVSVDPRDNAAVDLASFAWNTRPG
jgi:multidrug efflux pump subunit AcrB